MLSEEYKKRIQELAGVNESEIEKVERDNHSKYEYCDGILYKIGKEENTYRISVDVLEATPENIFTPDQIDRYKEYISDGGIIETFPVQMDKKAYNLKQMMEYIDENLDEIMDAFGPNMDYTQNKIISKSHFVSEVLNYDGYKLLDEDYWDEIGLEKFQYENILNIDGSAKSFEELVKSNDLSIKGVKEVLNNIKPIFDYFEEEQEFRLLDFNHRFEAVKRLGKKEVLVEEMK